MSFVVDSIDVSQIDSLFSSSVNQIIRSMVFPVEQPKPWPREFEAVKQLPETLNIVIEKNIPLDRDIINKISEHVGKMEELLSDKGVMQQYEKKEVEAMTELYFKLSSTIFMLLTSMVEKNDIETGGNQDDKRLSFELADEKTKVLWD